MENIVRKDNFLKVNKSLDCLESVGGRHGQTRNDCIRVIDETLATCIDVLFSISKVPSPLLSIYTHFNISKIKALGKRCEKKAKLLKIMLSPVAGGRKG